VGGEQGGHFADHGEDETFVPFGKGGAVFFYFGEEADFVLAEFAEHLLGFFIARSLGAGEKIGEGDFHGFRDFRERLERGNGVAVFDAREVAAQQAGLLLDVALGEPLLQTVRADGGANLHHFKNLSAARAPPDPTVATTELLA